jgi:hypothetical protein
MQGGGGAGAQSAEAKAFLEAVMPYIRNNASNPTGSANWTRNPDGSFNLDTKLNDANKAIYDPATAKLGQFIGGVNPNEQAPTLLDGSSGTYQQQLADTIFQRTWGTQANDIDEQRRKMEARLVEQGFVPGNEGYLREMNRFEDNLGELRQKVASDAQITAARQGLDEAKFTNESRTQGFKNTQELRAQIANLLAGARTNATAGLDKLITSSSAPTGTPGNAATNAQNQWTADLAAYQSKNQRNNDIIRALMQWGLS